MADPSMKVIVNCATTEFLGKCLESLRMQTVQDWKAFVTLDRGGREEAARAARSDPRISVACNSKRRYSLQNQIDAIARSGTDPEDVIVSLDGDDWLDRDDALSLIAQAYDAGAWMTYGSWFSLEGAQYGAGLWPAYPAGISDFRNYRWLATAVRTWKRWLWERVDDQSLRDDRGEYFRIAEDRAIMYPMLEMCGTERARHVAEPIMFYNQQAAYSRASEKEAARNVALLQRRAPRARIANFRTAGEQPVLR